MQSSPSDPSVLRRLALAFGEGVIFSVGMKLTEGAARPKAPEIAAGAAPDLGPLADRLGRIEQKLQEIDRVRLNPPAAQMDTKAVTAIVGVLEKHLNQHAEKVNQRIDGLQATVIASADAAAAQRVQKEAAALRDQVVKMQREILNSITQIISEQVAAQVSTLVATQVSSLVATQVGAEIAQRAAVLEAAMQKSVEAAVAPLRTEVRDLRRNISETDNNMTELVSAISDTVRRTSETLPAIARGDGQWSAGGNLDLKTIRKRLSNIDRSPAEPRFGLLPVPAVAQRRGPVAVRPFSVAS